MGRLLTSTTGMLKPGAFGREGVEAFVALRTGPAAAGADALAAASTATGGATAGEGESTSALAFAGGTMGASGAATIVAVEIVVVDTGVASS